MEKVIKIISAKVLDNDVTVVAHLGRVIYQI